MKSGHPYRSWVMIIAGVLTLLLHTRTHAQSDTTRHGWPVTPFFSPHPITGVFCEFRNTLSSDHFHNGSDVPEPDGSPVYPVYNGRIASIGTEATSGTSAYVRVDYTVSGFNKSDAYVHIRPNPLLTVGDSVYAYQTVLGNILTGQGHTHFTNGRVGSEMNGIRPEGGLTPYEDIYPPVIVSVRFFLDGSETEFVNNRVSGPVDIRVQVRETSAGDPSEVRSSTSNNGTFLIGYRILSADLTSVAFEPPTSGVRFRFDTKPSDTYVHRVFATGSDLSTHIYTITNGNGASGVSGSHAVTENSWPTSSMTPGSYVVMVFTEDTRGLADTAYVPVDVEAGDVVPPAIPALQSVISDSVTTIDVAWSPNQDADLMGYRIEFTLDGVNWSLRDDETVLGPMASSRSYQSVTPKTNIFFRLSAIDSAAPPNLSGTSDVYGVRLNNNSPVRTLIVDGFDRTEGSGSYHLPSHPFAMSWGMSVPLDFSTCANDDLLSGSVHMNDYDIVLWLLGDESSADETFSAAEQLLVTSYLQQGGKLFVSGSEVAYDLDRPSGPTQADRDFLHSMLKTRYIADDANQYTVTGEEGFADINLRYGLVAEGSPYEEDWPDVLAPEGGASTLLYYGAASGGVVAATGFKGVFPGGSAPGAVLVCGFPFETIVSRAARDTLFTRVFQYFDQLTSVNDPMASREVPDRFALEQNYPNPFNPSTLIRFSVAQERHVSLKVYDVLGREVASLVDEVRAPGQYAVRWDATPFSSGAYWYRMTAGDVALVRSMMVVK